MSKRFFSSSSSSSSSPSSSSPGVAWLLSPGYAERSA